MHRLYSISMFCNFKHILLFSMMMRRSLMDHLIIVFYDYELRKNEKKDLRIYFTNFYIITILMKILSFHIMVQRI